MQSKVIFSYPHFSKLKTENIAEFQKNSIKSGKLCNNLAREAISFWSIVTILGQSLVNIQYRVNLTGKNLIKSEAL